MKTKIRARVWDKTREGIHESPSKRGRYLVDLERLQSGHEEATDLGFHDEKEPDTAVIEPGRRAQFGCYAGWRIGITETGDWRCFVAGD